MSVRLRSRQTAAWRWAIRDISLTVHPGEAVALVGANGSGKSTLLKLLTRVMYPYAGKVDVAGRVGALIEVRAGIHPDLTGRENIYLYGNLLGLTRRQVSGRFDEIVEFAELSDAIDRQVKFYSMGMQMRLGFAVAAFLEPDVLLVDEVLAVGDAVFQQRCLDRMRALLAGGTTLVLVSHDLAAVEATCGRGIWLDRGSIQNDGPIATVLADYRRSIEESAENGLPIEGLVRLLKAEVRGPEGKAPATQASFEVTTVIESREVRSGQLFIGVSQGAATPVFVLKQELQLREGDTAAKLELPRLPLPRGRFYLWVGIVGKHHLELLPWSPVASFEVSGPELDAAPRGVVRLAPVHVEAHWHVD